MFFLRERFIKSHLALVDLFIAPSNFLLERFVDWGIPAERIVYEEYGRSYPHEQAQSDDNGGRARNRFGYFGQLSEFKGVTVALAAMRLLCSGEVRSTRLAHQSDQPARGRVARRGDVPTAAPEAFSGGTTPHLWIHGANLEMRPEPFQEEFASLLKAAGDNVTFVGKYDVRDLGSLIARVDWVVVPSRWWENSPLVIQEAFMYGRPVICSDIGGMAEKVTNGVNGLHFRAGDARDLAGVMQAAATTPGLWERLRTGIQPVYRIETSVARLAQLYDSLIADRVQVA